jgi:two-component system, OmpR family, sensor kinase
MKARFSLRTRLIVAVAAVALLALALADLTVYTALRSYLFQQADATLSASQFSVQSALADSGSGGPGGPPGGPDFCAVGRESAPGMFIEVRSTNPRAAPEQECLSFQPGSKSYSPSLPASIAGFAISPIDRHDATVLFTVGSASAGGPSFRVLASEIPGVGEVILADPIGNITNTLSQLLILELSVTAAALVGSVLLGLWLVRIGLRPLRDVERTAEAIALGDLMHRVPGANERTEVGHVATALNVMLERIQSAFRDLQASETRSRRFVSDASHELRTPIAAVSAYAQLFQGGAAGRHDDLDRVMIGIERESARMASLVDDLLLLARLDEHHLPDPEPVELVGLAAEAIETARTVGPAWPISLVAGEPVEVSGDRGALRQVIDNLLANVRAHTPQGTRTTVRVGRDHRDAVLEVTDEGPGITDQQAASVFERFFRSDPSRSRDTGGAGLGLAIVASIARAHGGRASAAARPGGGALFRIVIPSVEPHHADVSGRSDRPGRQDVLAGPGERSATRYRSRSRRL